MPLVIRLRQGKGKRPDRYCPVILCDYCGEEITKQGNFLWEPEDAWPENGGKAAVVFTHKHCNYAYERTRPDGCQLYGEELAYLPLFLERNIEISRGKIERRLTLRE